MIVDDRMDAFMMIPLQSKAQTSPGRKSISINDDSGIGALSMAP